MYAALDALRGYARKPVFPSGRYWGCGGGGVSHAVASFKEHKLPSRGAEAQPRAHHRARAQWAGQGLSGPRSAPLEVLHNRPRRRHHALGRVAVSGDEQTQAILAAVRVVRVWVGYAGRQDRAGAGAVERVRRARAGPRREQDG